jgi:TolB-like protein/DNA-binding winged helix-turn-helix (wHTH) protein/Tfp pilus assembly protein PilF
MSSTGVTRSRPDRLLELRSHQLAHTFERSNVTPIPAVRPTGRMLEQPSRANPIGDSAFRLGQWRVDPALNEISRDDTTVRLEPRTMRVLVCLAEHAGDVVNINQLLDTVWKDLVVTQCSVYQAVAALRRALGDDRKNPTYIASVVRRGYRLVAPVSTDAKVQDPAAFTAAPSSAADLHTERALAEDEHQHAGLDLPEASESAERGRHLRYASILLALLVLTGSVWWFFLRLEQGHLARASAARPPVTPARVEPPSVFTPPRHSVAVLPFSNLSGEPRDEYFSDGMSEELINALTQINALKVIARTSSFSFRDKDADIRTIARKLNVAAILEGSVRRSGNKVRITAQLIDTVSGFHIWSHDYDRDLDDVLFLQTDIARAVARELQATLLGDETPKMELGGTRNPAAFDAYLRGAKAYSTRVDARDCQTAGAAYTEAIRLDPKYALAFAARSSAHSCYAEEFATGPAVREAFDQSQADARQALALAPELAEAHAALGSFLASGAQDYAAASEEYRSAVTLAPGNAQVLRDSGRFEGFMGHFEAGLAAAHRAVVLDPLNSRSHSMLGQVLLLARRYTDAVAAFTEVISLDPSDRFAIGYRGLAYYGVGDLARARWSCETKPDHWATQWCLAITYDKLGRHADADAVVARMKATYGDAASYQYATIYAQWGNARESLQWLGTALRVRDPGLYYVKTDPLLDPLRKEPRFQAIERALKLPD